MNIHFVGIGGIGVSALAQYFLSKKDKVTGSDLVDSEITSLLRDRGAVLSIGKHQEKNLPCETDLVVFSPAITKDNPEIEKAKKLNIETKSYPEALGDLTKDYFTVAVSGTHGKSTTSAMISLILKDAGLDPTAILGTKLKEFNNSNFRMGSSKYLVIEADEYKGSFLNYHPDIIVLTNIEEDHLDYYKDIDEIVSSFQNFIKRIKENGCLIVNKDDKHINEITKSFLNKKEYSLSQEESQDVRRIIRVPGDFNVSNALAAITCAQEIGINKPKSLESIANYQGSWRRFELLKIDNINLIADYAHHPTELKKTLQAVREKFPSNKIISVFQPHQYQRSFHFFDRFVEILKNHPIDEVIVTDIYDVAGREESLIKGKVSSQKMVNAAKNKKTRYIKEMSEIKKYILKDLSQDDVVMIIGAGDIYNLFLDIKKALVDKKA